MASTQQARASIKSKVKQTFHPAFMLPPIKPADYSDLQFRLRTDTALRKKLKRFLHS
jgi:hypothetical protein